MYTKLVILVSIIAVVIILYNTNYENFGYYPGYVTDAYYPPTNCMDTLLGGRRCFPWFPTTYYWPYWNNYYGVRSQRGVRNGRYWY
jgi:hypothetical protein